MTINLTSPTCFVSAVLIGDTVISPNGVPDTIPEMTTVVNPLTGAKETANSALEIQSAAGGLLLPRLTQDQIDELDYKLKVDGMQVYNIDTSGVQVYRNGGFSTFTTQAGGSIPLFLYNNTNHSSLGISTVAYNKFPSVAAGNFLIGTTLPAGDIIGQRNILIGPGAAADITDGEDVIAIGSGAFSASTGASDSIAIGSNTLASLSSAGSAGTAVGWNSLNACTQDGNTAFGWNAGGEIQQGTFNVFIGDSAGLNGQGNDIQQTLFNNSILIGNRTSSITDPTATPGATDYLTCIGFQATTSGQGATVLGAGASAGQNSVAIGSGGTSAAGMGSIALGYLSNAPSQGGIALGSGATAQGANSVAIGPQVTSVSPNTINIGGANSLVGFNKPVPEYALDISNTIVGTDDLTAIQIAENTNPNPSTLRSSSGGILYVDQLGNLWFANDTTSYNITDLLTP